jgi:hypothetical protein
MSKNEIRSSQLLTTFGPGAMMDLPDGSVIVGGLGRHAMAACSCPKLHASSATNFSTVPWLSAQLKAVGLNSSPCHECR